LGLKERLYFLLQRAVVPEKLYDNRSAIKHREERRLIKKDIVVVKNKKLHESI